MYNKKVERPAARVFIVEDECIVSLDLQIMLENMGYIVAGSAETAAEAVDLVRALQPDVVLMDIMLPGGMDGIEAAEKIREYSPVPIVFCTANGDASTRSRAERVPGTGFLNKPVNPRALGTVIETLVSSGSH